MQVVDGLLVGCAVLASVAYALNALGPRTMRARVLAHTAALLARLPRRAGLSGMASWLRAAADRKAAGACGGCDSCGPAAEPAASGTAGAAPEVRIPLAKIGKRYSP